MIANAEAGYWNGARQPFGYEIRAATVLRKKEKRRLFAGEDEATVVRLIYKLYLEGDVAFGPPGVKAICSSLNARGYQTRGKAFRTAAVETILKSKTSDGTAWFNRKDSRTQVPRPPSEWIKVPVPAIHRSGTAPAEGGVYEVRERRAKP